MGSRTVRGHDQIEGLHYRRSVHEGAGSFIQLIAPIDDGKMPLRLWQLLRARSLLQADQANSWEPSKRSEFQQGNRAQAIIHILRVPLPRDADAKARKRIQLFIPV